MLREHHRFVIFSTPYTVFGVLRDRAVIFVLGAFVPAAGVGHYAFAHRILNFPVSLASTGIRPVLFREAASKSVRAVEASAHRLLRGLVIIASPALVLFLFHHDTLFGLAFGPKWTGSSELGLILIWAAFTFLLSNWMDRLYDVLSLQRLSLFLEVAFGVLSLLVLWSALRLDYSLEVALSGHCATLVVYNIVFTVMIYHRAGWAMWPLVEVLALFGGASRR